MNARGWSGSDWTSTSTHVRGSRRMLAVWAAGLVVAVVVSHHGYRVLAVVLGGLAVLAGTVLYTRLDNGFGPRQVVAVPPAVDVDEPQQEGDVVRVA